MQDKLERLEKLIESRRAIDFLDALIEDFPMFLGRFLIEEHMRQQRCEGCPECSDGFDDVIN